MHCHSCTAPLEGEYEGSSPIYCKYCVDEKGALKSRSAIREGLAGWFLSWQPAITKEVALARADRFMSALPAWAED